VLLIGDYTFGSPVSNEYEEPVMAFVIGVETANDHEVSRGSAFGKET
jgi:hypothetical protein